MEPIGPLMWEHRTIEQGVDLLKKGLEKSENNEELNKEYLRSISDFFTVYADHTHHGKEDDILFRDLEGKRLSDEHRKIMEHLKQDHVRGRELIQQIREGTERYESDPSGGTDLVKHALKELLVLYPRHIETEDKQFFYPAMEYFCKEEKGKMLEEFSEFDARLIHDSYKQKLEQIEEIL